MLLEYVNISRVKEICNLKVIESGLGSWGLRDWKLEGWRTEKLGGWKAGAGGLGGGTASLAQVAERAGWSRARRCYQPTNSQVRTITFLGIVGTEI